MRAFLSGATGTVGRQVVRALAARGVDVCMGTPALFEGVDALIVEMPLSEEQVAESKRVLAAAVEGGVSHVVGLSSRAVGWDEDSALHGWHRELEAQIRESGASWVILRPSPTFQRFFRDQARHVRDMSAIIAPLGEGLIAYVDASDVADVAAECLVDPETHDGKTYVLTGGRAYGMKGIAAEIGRVVGRPVTYIDVDEGQARELMARDGAPPSLIEAALASFAHARAGGEAAVDPTLARVLGRPATTLSELVERDRDAWT